MALRRLVLPALVFFTGACVLMVEVVSVRMLAPYFGNTIYSLSSILSVTLLALSLGYYFGGKLSDRFPRWNLFFGIIAAAGIAVGLMRAVSHPLLFALSQTTSATSGPLVASLLLFLVPAVFLGMLSPFAIKLEYAMEPKQGSDPSQGSCFSGRPWGVSPEACSRDLCSFRGWRSKPSFWPLPDFCFSSDARGSFSPDGSLVLGSCSLFLHCRWPSSPSFLSGRISSRNSAGDGRDVSDHSCRRWGDARKTRAPSVPGSEFFVGDVQRKR